VVAGLRPRDEGDTNLAGEVLRRATEADRARRQEILDEIEETELKRCRQLIKEHSLPMKLVGVEHLFGGHKIIFYFLADGRVDFRALVKDLAKEYRTRIELRQIGVRDEARLMGLVGPCGSELCCRRFLNQLKPIPMKLAKDQKSTLDPTKISGACGRLKCCLRFEEKLYADLKGNLPRRGSRVRTPHGEGPVVDYEIMAQRVLVEIQGEGCLRFPADQVEVLETK
jgi:cell fate regulator YaaT (PSP1 superfamily)